MKYDREQVLIAAGFQPPGNSPEDQQRGLISIALLAGATAAVVCRFGDELDLGQGLSPELREKWATISSALLELADLCTYGNEHPCPLLARLLEPPP